jgi:hypothetical protein
MKPTLLLAVVALAPAFAQTMKQAPPSAVAAKPAGVPGTLEQTPLQTILGLEKDMDQKLGTTGAPDPCVVRGSSRGIYVSGLGAVFSAEVELSATPGGIALFGQANQVGAEQKAKYHKTKMARVPVLEQTMRDMVMSLAASPALKLTDSDQVVVVVRLWYQRWEDTTGLPGQITARLDRRGGTVKLDVQ